MEKDERLTPLPVAPKKDLQAINQEYPTVYAPIYDDENFDERRSLRQYFNVIYKRLPIILALTILVTAAAAFYMYKQPSQFQAQTAMLIEPRKPKPQANSPVNINFGNDANYYATQLQLLQNPDLMKAVVVKLGLHRQPNLFAGQSRGLTAPIRDLFSSEKKDENQTASSSVPVLTETSATNGNDGQITLTPEEKALTERYAGMFKSGLTVAQVERTNIVNLNVVSTNAELSAKVADKVAEVYIEQDIERETQGAKRAYEELSKSIEDLKGTIGGQEADLLNVLSRNNLPNQENGSEFRTSVLTTVYGQYQEARNERLKIEARYNTAIQASNRGEGSKIPDLTENPIYRETVRINAERRGKLQDTIREIEKQIQQIEADKAELMVKYTPEYFKVKQAEEKIASLKISKEKNEKEVSSIIDRDQKKIEADAVSGALVGLRAQLDSAQKREAQLYDSYMKEEAKANIQGQAETRLTTLKREIETNRKLLDTYTQQQKQRELEIDGTRPDNIKIASRAVTQNESIGPQRNRNIMVAFLISLAAGIGLAFLMDYLDDSVRTSDDVGRHLGLPTLALIPHYNNSDKRKAANALVPIKNGNGNGSMALVTLEDQRSPMAEAYRHLRTSLLFSSAGKPPQTILVTSSQPSEGKTTTAINTAITLAQSNADVVIIDCDLRRPRLHNHFGMENTHGLTNYLSGERNTAQLLKPYKGLPRLNVITSGPIPPNPAELLSSNEMKNLLQFLKGKYKHVIIDSPPAISFTDAAILSTQVDGVVLVAMAGKSSVHLMRRFKQRLGTIGARIYGVVLNGIKANSADYDYYGYGYNYNYYTAADDDDSTPIMEDTSAIHETKS